MLFFQGIIQIVYKKIRAVLESFSSGNNLPETKDIKICVPQKMIWRE
jgi:hypothetical protein